MSKLIVFIDVGNMGNPMVDNYFWFDPNEGLSLGTSSGVNIAGAIRLGKELGPGKTIITILCDKSDRYNSKLFNKSFLQEKGLPYPNWL